MKIIANTNSPKVSITKTFDLLSLDAIDSIRAIDTQGSVTYSTIQDRIYASYPSITCVRDYRMNLITIGQKQNPNENVVWSSSNTSVATISSNGYVSHVSDGDSNITASIGGKTLSKNLTFSVINAVNTIFSDYASSSLAKSIINTIDSRISGKDPSISKNIFLLQDHANGIYTRNTQCWAHGLDLTCFSPWNSLDGPRRAGTLISPRHIICAQHYPLTVGTSIRFIRLDNTVVTKTITAIGNISNTDIQIALLDSDVGVGISFAQILPQNWYNYLPYYKDLSSVNYEFGLPSLCLDQEEKALILDIYKILSKDLIISYVKPFKSANSEFYEEIIVGDSGSPAFLIINGILVLMSCWYNVSSSSFIPYYKSQINSLMSQLGGNYQLTEIDLSSFSTY
jgi:hypothetical protein